MGIISLFVILYTGVIALSIYNVDVRKNQIDNTISEVLYQHLENNYIPEVLRSGNSRREIENIGPNVLKKELKERIKFQDRIDINVKTYNLDKGIISIDIIDHYRFFNGKTKDIKSTKTIIVDREDTEIKDKDTYVTLKFYKNDSQESAKDNTGNSQKNLETFQEESPYKIVKVEKNSSIITPLIKGEDNVKWVNKKTKESTGAGKKMEALEDAIFVKEGQ